MHIFCEDILLDSVSSRCNRSLLFFWSMFFHQSKSVVKISSNIDLRALEHKSLVNSLRFGSQGRNANIANFWKTWWFAYINHMQKWKVPNFSEHEEQREHRESLASPNKTELPRFYHSLITL